MILSVGEINIERYGRGEKLLFIHGSGWNTNLWRSQKEYFKNFMEVILIDLPGHGKSKGMGMNSVEAYKNRIKEELASRGLNGLIVAGHSLGGAIAMALALDMSELIKGLIIIGSGARLKVLPAILEGILHDKDRTIDFILSLAFSPKAEKALIDESKKEMGKCQKETIYGDFFACNNFDVMDRVKTIELPTLIICGLDDRLTPPKYAQYLKDQIRNSKMVLIEDAGHMVMLEKPFFVNKAIEDFLWEEKWIG